MKILPPHKIAGEISDVIYAAREYLIIASPYVDFNYWKRIQNELITAKNRGVHISFYVRNDSNNAKSWEQVESLGIRPILIDNLHAKFYLNERMGVISSMNLLSSSQSNSIEIGCKLESEAELEELKKFVDDFIKPHSTTEAPSEEDIYVSKERFSTILEGSLKHFVDQRARVYFKNDILTIYCSSNTYYCGVDKSKNVVYVDAILSGKDAQVLSMTNTEIFKPGFFNYQLIPGGNGNLDVIEAFSSTSLSNHFIDGLRVSEKKQLIEEIMEFITSVYQFKNSVISH
jgi:hypothetical protein